MLPQVAPPFTSRTWRLPSSPKEGDAGLLAPAGSPVMNPPKTTAEGELLEVGEPTAASAASRAAGASAELGAAAVGAVAVVEAGTHAPSQLLATARSRVLETPVLDAAGKVTGEEECC